MNKRGVSNAVAISLVLIVGAVMIGGILFGLYKVTEKASADTKAAGAKWAK